jgi:lipoyl synthase
LKESDGKYLRKPDWLRVKLTRAQDYGHVKGILGTSSLHTICESGACPNKAECWAAGTATFMILGDICTRNCRFCNVKTGRPLPPDLDEPFRVAESVRNLGVKHCVITSVDRDDLGDGGASIWAATIRNIRVMAPGTTIETLIPDFNGNGSDIQKIIDEKPDIIGHNLETVKRLTREVRIFANYNRSLEVLAYISKVSDITTKSGIMLGLGETEEEISETMDDLISVQCKVLTMGQYLQPTRNHLPVKKYIHPDNFDRYGNLARAKGFAYVESAPLVRSSYHAEKTIKKV